MKKALFLSVILVGLFLVGCTGKTSEKQGVKEPLEAKPVEIYFVRHGKTMFNTTGQVQGWSDSLLTDQGIEQAIASGKGLEDVTFLSAYSSDMGRARHTAQYILAENQEESVKAMTVTELKGLREWGYGGYEGRDDAELWTPLFAEKGIKFEKDWSTWEALTAAMTDEEMANAIAKNDPTQTAENYDDIIKRSKEAVEQIVKEAEKQGGGKVLAVSHGSEIPTILSIFTPENYNGESIGNCSLTILKIENGQYSLEEVGDLTYME